MFELFNFLWTAFFSLTGWQMILWIMYFIYFICKTYWYFVSAQEYGIIDGYKQVMFGRSNSIRLYHIFMIVWDLPMSMIGLFLPFLKKTLTFPVYRFQNKDQEKDKNTK